MPMWFKGERSARAAIAVTLLATACSNQSTRRIHNDDRHDLNAHDLGLIPNQNVKINITTDVNKVRDLPLILSPAYLQFMQNAVQEGIIKQFNLKISERWKITTKSRQINFGGIPAAFTETRYRGILQNVEVDTVRGGHVVGISCRYGSVTSYLVYETSICKAAVERAFGAPTPMATNAGR